MKLFAVLALVMLPLPAAAGPAEAKAWLCRTAPTWQMCLVPVIDHPVPSVAFPEVPQPTPAPAQMPGTAMPQAEPWPPVVPLPAPVAKPAPAPKPKAKPRAQRDDDDEDERPARKPVARSAARPAYCAQIAEGIRTMGKKGVRRAASALGYSDSQIARAQAECGY